MMTIFSLAFLETETLDHFLRSFIDFRMKCMVLNEVVLFKVLELGLLGVVVLIEGLVVR